MRAVARRGDAVRLAPTLPGGDERRAERHRVDDGVVLLEALAQRRRGDGHRPVLASVAFIV
jgi:hypothetical protein